MKGFRPFDDLVVVKREESKSVSAGGIYIPAVAQEQLDIGTLVAKGPGKRSEKGTILPMEVKVGDTVMFSKYANMVFRLNGESFVTMREGDLMGVLE